MADRARRLADELRGAVDGLRHELVAAPVLRTVARETGTPGSRSRKVSAHRAAARARSEALAEETNFTAMPPLARPSAWPPTCFARATASARISGPRSALALTITMEQRRASRDEMPVFDVLEKVASPPRKGLSARSASAASRAVAKRSEGSLAIIRATMASSSGWTSFRSSRTWGVSWKRIFARTATTSCPRNGACPVRHAYRTQPREKRSDLESIDGDARACSGDT